VTMNKNGSFTGRVAFVTGAANGIGRATALAFAREAANVVVADVSEEGNQETSRMIEEQGGRALAIRCDVTRAEGVKAALERIVAAITRASSRGSRLRPRTTTRRNGTASSVSISAASFCA